MEPTDKRVGRTQEEIEGEKRRQICLALRVDGKIIRSKKDPLLLLLFLSSPGVTTQSNQLVLIKTSLATSRDGGGIWGGQFLCNGDGKSGYRERLTTRRKQHEASASSVLLPNGGGK